MTRERRARTASCWSSGRRTGCDPAVERMREIVGRAASSGRLRMIANLVYGDFLYRPRRPEELDTARGGGIMYNQIPHQIEIARALDGGPLRSVRAVTGVWDAPRPTEGAMTALLRVRRRRRGVAHLQRLRPLRHRRAALVDRRVRHAETARRLRCRAPRAARRRRARTRETRAEGGLGVRRTRRDAARRRARRTSRTSAFCSCRASAATCVPRATACSSTATTACASCRCGRGARTRTRTRVLDELYDAVATGSRRCHDGAWGTETVAPRSRC